MAIDRYIPLIESLAVQYENDYIELEDLKSEAILEILIYLHRGIILNDKLVKNIVLDKFSDLLSKIVPTEEFENNMLLIDLNITNFEKLSKAMHRLLIKRDSEILLLRYGIYGKTYTLQQIADMYGLSRERVRQIVYESIWKLKKYFRRNDIKCIEDFEGDNLLWV